MAFFNSVFREILSDPFLMAPLPPPAPLLVSPAQHMARMMRMMDSMHVVQVHIEKQFFLFKLVSVVDPDPDPWNPYHFPGSGSV